MEPVSGFYSLAAIKCRRFCMHLSWKSPVAISGQPGVKNFKADGLEERNAPFPAF
jgi:hypothetical protein